MQPTRTTPIYLASLFLLAGAIGTPSGAYAAPAWGNLGDWYDGIIVDINLSLLIASVLILSLLYLILTVIQAGRPWNKRWLLHNRSYHLVVGLNPYNQRLITTSWNNTPLLVINQNQGGWSIIYQANQTINPHLNSAQQAIAQLDMRKLKDCIIGMEDDEANIAFAIALLKRLAEKGLPKKTRKHPSISRIFVRIEHQDLATLFKQHATLLSPTIDITIYSIHELLVRDMFAQQAFLNHRQDILASGADYEVAIIGTSALAAQIVWHLANLAHLPKQNTLRINVVDKHATAFVDYLRQQFVGIERIPHVHLNTITADANNLDYYTHAIWHTPNLINVFIATPNAQKNMESALNLKNITYLNTIANRALNTQIWFATYDSNFQGDILNTAKQYKSFAHFHTFADFNQALSADNFFDNDLDKLAKLINFSYNNINANLTQEDIDNHWMTLSNHKKQSSKSQAQHLNVKLLALGLKKVACPQTSFDDLWQQNLNTMRANVVGFDFFMTQAQHFTPDQFPRTFETTLIEQLARAEHNRWNAFHYLRGWQHHANKSGADGSKLHYCLLPIEAFDNDLIKSTYQYDLQSVINIPKYLAYMNYAIVDNDLIDNH